MHAVSWGVRSGGAQETAIDAVRLPPKEVMRRRLIQLAGIDDSQYAQDVLDQVGWNLERALDIVGVEHDPSEGEHDSSGAVGRVEETAVEPQQVREEEEDESATDDDEGARGSEPGINVSYREGCHQPSTPRDPSIRCVNPSQ
jgi:hypothetical protein